MAKKKGDKGHLFSSDNQPSNKRGETERTKWIRALKKVKFEDRFGNETHLDEGMLKEHIIHRALSCNDKMAFEVMCEKIFISSKPVKPGFVIEGFPHDGTPLEKAECIVAAVANGMPADVGDSMLNMITKTVTVNEFTDLIERIRAIEGKTEQQGEG